MQGLVNLLPSRGPSRRKRRCTQVTSDLQRYLTSTRGLSRIHPSIDHFRFPNDDPGLMDAKPIMAEMAAGDLLLWDSRTIHCSAPGLKDPESSLELLRAASLVCMMPRSNQIQTSSPGERRRLRPALQRQTGAIALSTQIIPQIAAVEDSDKYAWPPEPELNHNQMRLAGWSEEELAGL